MARNLRVMDMTALTMCRENGIAVIPGSCPNQFLQPDFGHKLMRVVMRTLGFLRVNDNGASPARP